VGALNLRRGRSAGRECLSKPDPRKNLQSRRGIERMSHASIALKVRPSQSKLHQFSERILLLWLQCRPQR
jgi:hypothetical protein